MHRERQSIIEPNPPRKVTLDTRKVQKKFKHATALGIEGNYNIQNAKAFLEAIRIYVEDPEVEQIVGTFRSDPVIHYYHAKRKVNLMTELDGTFISVWGLNPEQIMNLETRGSL